MMGLYNIAIINYRNDRKRTIWLKSVIVLCSVLFVVMASLSSGFTKIANSYKTDDISLRTVSVNNQSSENNSIPDAEMILELSNVIFAEQKVTIRLNNKFYMEIGDGSLLCLSRISAGNNKMSSFSFQAIEEMNNNSIPTFVSGRDFNKDDSRSAIIDENVCYLLGYKEPELLIGENINLVINNNSVENIKIVGVYSYLLGNIKETYADMPDWALSQNSKSSYLTPFIITDDLIPDIESTGDIKEITYGGMRITVDNTDNVSKICNEIENIFGYNTGSLIKIIEKKAAEVRSLSVFVSIILMFFFIVTISGICNSLLIRIRKEKEYAILLNKIGYKKTSISLSFVVENIFLIIESYLWSFLLSGIIMFSIDFALSKYYREITSYSRFVFSINFALFGQYCLAVIVFVSLASLVISSIQVRGWNKK